jgi:hypothetical protein
MDLVAVTEDERCHLWVPETGLVAEVDTGFEHFAHCYGHGISPGLGLESGQSPLRHPLRPDSRFKQIFDNKLARHFEKRSEQPEIISAFHGNINRGIALQTNLPAHGAPSAPSHIALQLPL